LPTQHEIGKIEIRKGANTGIQMPQKIRRNRIAQLKKFEVKNAN